MENVNVEYQNMILRNRNRIAIWGGGYCGKIVNEYLRLLNIRPAVLIDKDNSKENTILPEEFYRLCGYYFVIVATQKYEQEICLNLSEHDYYTYITFNELFSRVYIKSYAQCGEDAIAYFLLHVVLNMKHICYCDIGAFDPIRLSNTYLFYECGDRGLCVEPNEELIPLIKKYRSEDTVLNCGAGVEDGELIYYSMDCSSLNSFSKEEAERYEQMGHTIVGKTRIPILAINHIFESYGPFEYLSIDVEGLDFDLLKRIDYDRYAPVCICVETQEYIGGKRDDYMEIVSYMESKGYELYADTRLNTLFVLKKKLEYALSQSRNRLKSPT